MGLIEFLECEVPAAAEVCVFGAVGVGAGGVPAVECPGSVGDGDAGGEAVGGFDVGVVVELLVCGGQGSDLGGQTGLGSRGVLHVEHVISVELLNLKIPTPNEFHISGGIFDLIGSPRTGERPGAVDLLDGIVREFRRFHGRSRGEGLICRVQRSDVCGQSFRDTGACLEDVCCRRSFAPPRVRIHHRGIENRGNRSRGGGEAAGEIKETSCGIILHILVADRTVVPVHQLVAHQ